MILKGTNLGLENQKWGPYNEGTKAGRRDPTMMTRQQYEELKDAIKVLFELLTYEEQEQVIAMIKEHCKNKEA